MDYAEFAVVVLASFLSLKFEGRWVDVGPLVGGILKAIILTMISGFIVSVPSAFIPQGSWIWLLVLAVILYLMNTDPARKFLGYISCYTSRIRF